MAATDDAKSIAAETVGTSKSEISVEISTRFLEQFSEQLYSSPQKAFEELISNSWDAGANSVDIRIPDDLADENATITVLDNGVSMDEDGLRALWHIAFSPKRENRVQFGRQMVGKFGIGKLATYLLANRLTYICRSEDGVVRRVTMDYGEIDSLAEPERLVSKLSLDLFEVTDEELEPALQSITHGTGTYSLLRDGFHIENDSLDENDDFGAEASKLERDISDTWTLVILSGLKPAGRDLKPGILRRMLRAALPLSSEMVIRLNDEVLASTKLDVEVAKSWRIGPSLGITEIEIRERDGVDENGERVEKTSKIAVSSGDTPLPFVELPEIGRVTGTVTLYTDKISGGKSEERGTSNGFHVNVFGRIVNQSDPSFGEENLSHAAWSRFRMSVRADGLDKHLTTNREQFQEQRSLRIFRAFLRLVFNLARSSYDSDEGVELADGGDALVKSLGVLSLAPLRSAVSETLKTEPPLPGLFDDDGIEDREKMREQWYQNTGDNIRNALDTVKFENASDGSFVKFRIADNSIVINKRHPFVAEHSRTKAEKELLRTVGMVSLLSDIYALENGVEADKLRQVREFRDRLMQFKAYQQRQSGTNIAQILLSVQSNSSESLELETILADALRYIGWDVRVVGGSGEPEGIAKAFSFSRQWSPTEEEPERPIYSFTYDAKAAASGKAKTGNLSLDGVNEHRKRYKADYALVMAPGFQDGAAVTRAGQLGITLMKAADLGRLLELTVELGAIPLDQLETVFGLHDPAKVSEWVTRLESELRSSRKLTIDIFLKALDVLKGKVPDLLHPSQILLVCRTQLGMNTIKEDDVVSVVKGMAILVPDLVGYDERAQRVVVNASSQRVAEAVSRQIEKLRISVDDDKSHE
jgi:hypothetical protein